MKIIGLLLALTFSASAFAFSANNIYVCDNGSTVGMNATGDASGVHHVWFINGSKLSFYNGGMDQYWTDSNGSEFIFQLDGGALTVYQADRSGNAISTWNCQYKI